MRIEQVLKVGWETLTKAKKPYVKPTCTIYPFDSLGGKMKWGIILDSLQISERNKSWRSLVNDLNCYIKPEKFLGCGSEARVYKLNDNYVLRLYRGKKSVDNQYFKPVQDIFEGRNYGQAVAISEDGTISINKFVNGNIMFKSLEYEPTTYLKNLRQYSELPDETIEKFVEDISFINKKGYNIDERNPENFLYNSLTQRIGIIDISNRRHLYNPYGHDWALSALCNGQDFLDIASRMNVSQKKEMVDLITKLEARIIPMCKKHNIPLMKYNKEEYRQFSLAEFLYLKNKINLDSHEGICTQMIKLNHPEDIELLKDMKPEF